ncbi:hypothetical protein Zmor_018012 [Zophobas morio]|uniref:Uncharacterized protein n=1 Tax=Zophobas morio TaxID=2755281 RepID=A0AA38MDH0_9CUCU|nr:hypothetical protein Zmor_018012 [Zophobas morio]
MSLIDLRFEKAAKILAESEDEVLEAAGLMALMRLETLKRRLKQSDTGGKPLMPILVQNKDTTPSRNTSTAWCYTSLPTLPAPVITTQSTTGRPFDSLKISFDHNPITVSFSNSSGSLKSSSDSKTAVATAQSVNSASLDLFSSPKSSCDSKTLATTAENSNFLSSNLFSSPKSTFEFNTTPTTVQTANAVFSSVFTSPISSSGCNTTATTIQSVNVLGSSVFTRPSFDLNMTSTTTHSTNAISSILLPSAKTRGDVTNMEPVATTSSMLISMPKSSRLYSQHQKVTTKTESSSSSRSSSPLNSFNVKKEKEASKVNNCKSLQDYNSLEWNFDLSKASSSRKSTVRKIPETKELILEKKSYGKNEHDSLIHEKYITDIRKNKESTSSSAVVPIRNLEREFGNLQVAKKEGTRSSLQVARPSSAEKQNEHRHFQANFLRNSQTFSPVYNIYETYNQSWHYNYTSPHLDLVALLYLELQGVVDAARSSVLIVVAAVTRQVRLVMGAVYVVVAVAGV